MTGPAGPLAPAVVIHSLDHGREALAAAAGRMVRLFSPPACPALHGIGWWQRLIRRLGNENAAQPFQPVLDCGTDCGWALAALRAGVRQVVVAGDGATVAAVRAVAEQRGAWGEARGEFGTLDLLGDPDPGRSCREFYGSFFTNHT